jgi:hypothetical protein
MQHMVLSLSTRVRGGLSVHSLSENNYVYILTCTFAYISCEIRNTLTVIGMWIINQLDALNFSNIFICMPLSTCFEHYVPIIRRDPIALTQLLYLSFRFSCVSCEFTYSAHKIHS